MGLVLTVTDRGLYCPEGDFYIDPWEPVDRAVITHAHSDHARPGSRIYLCAKPGAGVLAARLGPEAVIDAVGYGETRDVRGVRVSLHPAGHILGSAQVRVEHLGKVWVVSGDYKTEADPTCTSFEPIRCHTFITESTFGLPIYRWPAQAEVFAQIDAWWRGNQAKGVASVLYGYALGKAQRVLAGLNPETGPIFCHGAVLRLNDEYRRAGVPLAEAPHAGDSTAKGDYGRALILAPPSADGTPWLRRFGHISTGFCSGWMRIRGTRRRRAMDRGFVLSDHADWPGLLSAIKETEAESVWVTHGYRAPLVRWLRDEGWDAHAVETRFEGEVEDSTPVPAEDN
ncbi:MAG: ligase-associated DNA damage response exonuclease [Bryobacteraceae bacterium]